MKNFYSSSNKNFIFFTRFQYLITSLYFNNERIEATWLKFCHPSATCIRPKTFRTNLVLETPFKVFARKNWLNDVTYFLNRGKITHVATNIENTTTFRFNSHFILVQARVKKILSPVISRNKKGNAIHDDT